MAHRLFFLTFLLLFGVFGSLAQAQNFGGNGLGFGGPCLPAGTQGSAIRGNEIGACMVAGMTSFYLKNRGDQTIRFRVYPENGTWRTLSLGPGQGDAIFCSGCSATFFNIEIKTGDKKVSYRLDPGERYAIYWNSDEDVWDLVRVAS